MIINSCGLPAVLQQADIGVLKETAPDGFYLK